MVLKVYGLAGNAEGNQVHTLLIALCKRAAFFLELFAVPLYIAHHVVFFSEFIPAN